MKKTITLLLALVMCLSMCACGGGKGTLYAIGDTVSTDCAQLTLEALEFTDTYNSYKNVDGKIFAVLTFSMKNTGKTKLGYIKTVEGKIDSLMYSAIPCIDYNDGYLFSYDDKVGTLELCSTDYPFSDLEPLSIGEKVEVAILVPHYVADNENDSLLVKMAVPTTKGTKIFVYKIR